MKRSMDLDAVELPLETGAGRSASFEPAAVWLICMPPTRPAELDTGRPLGPTGVREGAGGGEIGAVESGNRRRIWPNGKGSEPSERDS